MNTEKPINNPEQKMSPEIRDSLIINAINCLRGSVGKSWKINFNELSEEGKIDAINDFLGETQAIYTADLGDETETPEQKKELERVVDFHNTFTDQAILEVLKSQK